MFSTLFVIVASTLPAFIINEEECPNYYLRFSKQHSMCQPANPSCLFLAKGLQNKEMEIAEILDVHNDYRSKVATGQEKLGGGLPTASNMIELTWDEELHKIAQKWAEQCKFQHDCGECRASRSFSVGQNIAFGEYSCQGECDVKKPNWNGTIKMWYDEVKDFKKELIPSLKFSMGTGHFTQVSWAETYKIGCGYAAYKNDKNVRQLYVCNYGPAGNMGDASMYKEGPSCSNCPENSCCGDKCSGKKSFPGLCHLESSPPIYPSEKRFIYSCTFLKNDQNCEYDTEGVEKWEIVETPGGAFLSVVAKEDETVTVHFKQTVKVKKGSCMKLYLRKGPTVAADKKENNLEMEKEESKLEVEFDQNGQKSTMPVWSYVYPDFIESPVWMDYDGDIKFSVKLAVLPGAPPQFLEIKKIEITEEACS